MRGAMVTARTQFGALERARLGAVLRRLPVLLLALLCATAWAADRVAVPEFPSRVGVPDDLGERFSQALRSELAAADVDAVPTPLITPGIAGSLEFEFARLIAELEGTRYALSGEVVARPGTPGAPFSVNVLIVDDVQGRSSDVLSRSFAVATLPRVAADVAAVVMRFMEAAPELPVGDAALFVSTVPRSAEVRIDGVPVGVSGAMDVISLHSGRYELEFRLDGYLPEVRTVDLRSGDTRFVHVVMTEVAGGSIRVTSVPDAMVYLDGVLAGSSPVTLTSLPGVRAVRVERPGFESASFSVGVRNFRVHRIDAVLTPLAPTMLVWSLDAPGSVVVGGVLQRHGHAPVDVGLVWVERIRDGAVQRKLLAVPERGVYRLDLDSLEIVPLAP